MEGTRRNKAGRSEPYLVPMPAVKPRKGDDLEKPKPTETSTEQARKDGVRDLRQSGLAKVKAGVTTLEEVIAVTNE